MPLSNIDVVTTQRCELVDVTKRVAAAVRASRVENGVCYVFSPHTTAAVTVNENTDPEVRRDLLYALEHLVPQHPKWGDFRHGEGNSDAHVKASLVGASQVVPVEGGKLALGTWQAIYLCEFDGPRNRRLVVKVFAG